MIELTEEQVTKVIRPRQSESHKGDYGRVVLIGGNSQYGGAIIMSAEACVHAGAGLTTVVTATKNHSSLHSRLPEVMVVDWKEEVTELLETADVVVIGPGLGLSDFSKRLLQVVLQKQNEQWLIIDGSGITLFAADPLPLNNPARVVFTPHQMEWQRLSGLKIAQQTPEKNQAAQQKLGATIVLKSHRTEIYTADQIYTNPLGNPAMATGGMGDTLAGMIAGFLAQFPSDEQTIGAAVYLHSLIGDSLAEKNYVVLPTEISRQLPLWMRKFADKK
ncbi:NAD(P)H-hydrate dehydratase [Enterococcus sp. JM9B]|uniref:NAD(P)H-hydrate dehydratase n=1 Tax=Enterococcus sp. JM9B TaxID=1857216 RepID=UPI001375257F|nr:NAD(P)H-hydrate dehydratase [Enterococcus sp. JM9B]KAF1304974.1 NAD(P)H-hydrate dehydratase [Enterococcus sp. JM9B]